MSIATRTGDRGTTGLLHGQRVPKDHPQIEAVGAFDELNVEVGAARLAAAGPGGEELLAEHPGHGWSPSWARSPAPRRTPRTTRSPSMRGARRGGPPPPRRVSGGARVEGPAHGWLGHARGQIRVALAFDRARVAARRAERRLAGLSGGGRSVRPLVFQWTNRLSDILWLLAREAETRAKTA